MLSLKSGAPLRVDDKIMLEISELPEAGNHRQADLVLPEKREPALPPTVDVLQNEFQRAVENKEHEQAATLRWILGVLQDANE
ncbi:MAG: hypothetical protein FJ217_02025 [Ignavibacteria bacterium]|nr:hypothetical protein [Ignavibacteria bacterium]